MIDSLFGQLAGVLKTYFSRAFWFASFMPVAMAVALHLIIAGVTFPAVVPLAAWLHAGAGALTIIPLIAAGVFVLAYAVGPLTPVARGFLDASRLPPWLQDLLRKSRLNAAHKARLEIAAAVTTLAAYQRMKTSDVTRMVQARASGVPGSIPNPDQARTAARGAKAIADEIARGGLPAATRTAEEIAKLILALSANDANLAPGQKDADLAAALTGAQGAIAVALIRAEAEAEHRLAILRQRCGSLGSSEPPEATRMGDARQAAEIYSKRYYGVRFEYIWPRLWLVMTEKDGFGAAVSDAQSQVDFAVLSTFLTASLPVVWLPVLTFCAPSWWLLPLVAGGGVLLCGLFYELAIAGQWALVHVVRAAIDRYRVDLLKVLYQPLPATRFAERRIWSALELEDNAPGTTDVSYRFTP